MSDVWAIDVSRWQGDIDWATVKSQGVGGAWIKVGGSDGGLYTDSKASRNVNGAASVQLPFGTYYYVRPTVGGGRGQAEHAVSVGHGQGELWPTLDIEENPNGLAPAQLDEFVVEFNGRVKELTGRDSIVYTGAYSGVGSTGAVSEFPLWIANYGLNSPNTQPPVWNPKTPPAWPTWQVWQFNSVTRVIGIPGNVVDQNVVKGEFWARMFSDGDELVAAADEINQTILNVQSNLTNQIESARAGLVGEIALTKQTLADALQNIEGNLARAIAAGVAAANPGTTVTVDELTAKVAEQLKVVPK